MGEFGGIATIVVGALALIGGVYTAKSSTTGPLVERVSNLEKQANALSDYVHVLRDHIAQGQPPPPPPYPENLRV